MKAQVARVINRYAALRKLRSRVLKRRWEAQGPKTRTRLLTEMTKVLVAHDMDQARRRVDEAFFRA